MNELEASLPFTLFASLPLDLVNAVTEQTGRRRGDERLVRTASSHIVFSEGARRGTLIILPLSQLHAESIFRFAVLDVYYLKLNSIVALFSLDKIRHDKLTSWSENYLDHHAEKSTWFEDEMPRRDQERVWAPHAVQRYWHRYGDAICADWRQLDAVRVELLEKFCETRVLPPIDSVVRTTRCYRDAETG
jgi:hypothetical protein